MREGDGALRTETSQTRLFISINLPTYLPVRGIGQPGSLPYLLLLLLLLLSLPTRSHRAHAHPPPIHQPPTHLGARKTPGGTSRVCLTVSPIDPLAEYLIDRASSSREGPYTVTVPP